MLIGVLKTLIQPKFVFQNIIFFCPYLFQQNFKQRVKRVELVNLYTQSFGSERKTSKFNLFLGMPSSQEKKSFI
jgi:hypothetical protein